MAHELVLNVSIDNPKFHETIREHCLSKNKELAPNTRKTYPSQLKSLISRLGVKTLAQALTKTVDDYKEALKDVKDGVRSAYVNSIVSVCKACQIPVNIDFNRVKDLNIALSNVKNDNMKKNIGEIPAGFDKKVKDYLEKNKGSMNAVIIALMALSPTVRGHMMEGLMIARGQDEYDRIKKENKYPVIGIIGNKYKFNYVAGNSESRASAKVKSIQEEVEYPEAVVEQLKAYIKPSQKYMFPPKRTGKAGAYISGKTFNEWITVAFDAAGIPDTGVQKLRRIYETRISSNPTMSMADKEILSRQMNHSRIMGEKYVIVPTSDDSATQRIIEEMGKEIAEIFVILASKKSKASFKRAKDMFKDIKTLLQYDSPEPSELPTPSQLPMPPQRTTSVAGPSTPQEVARKEARDAKQKMYARGPQYADDWRLAKKTRDLSKFMPTNKP